MRHCLGSADLLRLASSLRWEVWNPHNSCSCLPVIFPPWISSRNHAVSIKSAFTDSSGQTRERHNRNVYSLSDMFTFFFLTYISITDGNGFFSSWKSTTEFMFYRLNCRSKRDVGAAACLILIVVCSPGGGKSRWNRLVSAVRQGVRQNMSERWRLMHFREQEMHVSAAPTPTWTSGSKSVLTDGVTKKVALRS